MDSVSLVADEIVVMDSFSTDRTALIVEQKGGRLFRQPFEGYGAQRNAATVLAMHDYVLFLDADEFLGEDLNTSILAEKKRGFPSDGYLMNRLNNYCGQWIRHGSWYPDRKLRLINRKQGAWNLDLVHESIILHRDARIGLLNGDLLHITYADFHEHAEKNNRYSDLSALQLFNKGRRPNPFNIVFNPFWAFFSSYFLRAGFLDGIYGFIIAVNIAHLTFMKYTKLYQLVKKDK